MHPTAWPMRNPSMSSALILLLVFVVPYVGLNLWRLARGRSWAFTFCHVMKEWEREERLRRTGRDERRHSPS